jgi:hypothetical protein
LALALVTFTVAARGSLFSKAWRRHRSMVEDMVEDLVEDEVFCLGKWIFLNGCCPMMVDFFIHCW